MVPAISELPFLPLAVMNRAFFLSLSDSVEWYQFAQTCLPEDAGHRTKTLRFRR